MVAVLWLFACIALPVLATWRWSGAAKRYERRLADLGIYTRPDPSRANPFSAVLASKRERDEADRHVRLGEYGGETLHLLDAERRSFWLVGASIVVAFAGAATLNLLQPWVG